MKRCLPFLSAVLLLPACRESAAPEAPPPPLVQVSRPLQRDVPVIVEVIGQTEAIANVEIRSRVEATVQKIAYVEGSRVSEGDLLFVLDKEPIQQRLTAAKGNLGQLQAAVEKSQLDVKRLTPLAAQSAVPQRDLDNAITALRQAEAGLESAQAQVRTAEIDLGYTDVKAPVSGIIGAKQVDVGSLVSRSPGTVMAVMSPLDPIWANVEISEVAYLNHAAKFKDVTKEEVFTLLRANGEVHPQPGRLAFVDRTVNPTTGTLKVRVEFPNPGDILRPGQFCRVRALVDTLKDALLIPQRAVQELQGLHNVFVIGADGKAAFTRVEMGPRIGSLWVVKSGLKPDDQVVIEGLQKARHGAPVQTQPAEIDDAPLKEVMATVPHAAAKP